jgi:hypothetical protein
VGKYTTHKSTNDQCRYMAGWHTRYEIETRFQNCSAVICKTPRPNRITHLRSMVSCKRCIGLLGANIAKP